MRCISWSLRRWVRAFHHPLREALARPIRDNPVMTSRRLPSRIVCLTTETVEVLYALGEEERIAGISG